jgi:plasmid stabilization system protein ParE
VCSPANRRASPPQTSADAPKPNCGLEFFDAVDAVVEQIGRLLRAGALVRRVPEDLQVRWAPVKRFPYRVIYLETESVIRILAIAHDRRRPTFWIDRL